MKTTQLNRRDNDFLMNSLKKRGINVESLGLPQPDDTDRRKTRASLEMGTRTKNLTRMGVYNPTPKEMW